MEQELMGPAEIAVLFGVSRQRVTQLVARPDFPAPAAQLIMGNVWRTTDIRAWGVKDGRLTEEAHVRPSPKGKGDGRGSAEQSSRS